MDLLECCGHSYNTGTNMAGKYIGVHSRLFEMNEKALFGPCNAHILNILSDSAQSLVIDVSFFWGVNHLYIIFCLNLLL